MRGDGIKLCPPTFWPGAHET